MAECRVRVLNVPCLHNVDLLDKLTIYFLRERNGGGDLADVSYCTDTHTEAIVTFVDPAVAKRVLERKDHMLSIKGTQHSLQVVPLKEEDSGEVIEKVIMVINLFRIRKQQHDGFLENLKRFPVTVSLNQSRRQCTVEGPFSQMEEIHTYINTFVNEYKAALEEGNTENEEFKNEKRNISHNNASEIENDTQTEIHSKVYTENVPEGETSEHQERLASGSENQSKVLGELGESGNREETIQMAVESDVFTYLCTNVKGLYDGILTKYNVEVLSNDLCDLTMLNVKSKAGLPSSKQQMQNATEELAALLAELQNNLRKDTVRLNSAFAKNSMKVNALCQYIKEQYQNILITYKEGEFEVHFIGTADDIFHASSLLRKKLETSGTALPNRESGQVSDNYTEHPPAPRSDIYKIYPEEHNCSIHVDCDRWMYLSYCHMDKILFVCNKYNAGFNTIDVKNNKTLVILTSRNRDVLYAKEELSSMISEYKDLHKETLKYEKCNLSPTSNETNVMLQSLKGKHQWVLILEEVDGIMLMGQKEKCLSVIEELKALCGKQQETFLEESQVQNVKKHLQETVEHGQDSSIAVDDAEGNFAPSIAYAQPSLGHSQPSPCLGCSEVGLKDNESAIDVQHSLQADQDLKCATDEAKVNLDANADGAQSSSGSSELHINENPEINVENNNNQHDQHSHGAAVNVQDVNVTNDEENITAPPIAAGGGQAEDFSEIHRDKESGHIEASLTSDIPPQAENPEPCEESNLKSKNVQMDTLTWKYIKTFMLKDIEESASKQNVEIKVVKELPIIELTISGMAESNVSALTNVFNERVQECRKMHRAKISGNVLELIKDEKTLRYFVDAINITGLKVVLHKMPKSVFVFGEKEPCLAAVEQIKIIAEKFTSSDGEATGNGGKDFNGKTQLEECCSEAAPNMTADFTEPVLPMSDEQQ